MLHGIRLDELVRLMPRLKPYLSQPNPSSPEIVDAADRLRPDLGVSKSLCGEACLAMGRELAAVALAVVSAKEAGHFPTTLGRCFHGMVAKAAPGASNARCGRCAGRRSRNPSGEGAYRRDHGRSY